LNWTFDNLTLHLLHRPLYVVTSMSLVEEVQKHYLFLWGRAGGGRGGGECLKSD
jgi:hypothetical protein